jgi:hypothetical protein
MQPLLSLLCGGFGETIKSIHGDDQCQLAWFVWLVELVGTWRSRSMQKQVAQPEDRDGSDPSCWWLFVRGEQEAF